MFAELIEDEATEVVAKVVVGLKEVLDVETMFPTRSVPIDAFAATREVVAVIVPAVRLLTEELVT